MRMCVRASVIVCIGIIIQHSAFANYFKYASGHRQLSPDFKVKYASVVLWCVLWLVCDTAQLLRVRFWRMGHGWKVNTLATAVGGEKCIWDWEVL